MTSSEKIDHPAHYNQGGIEAIAVIEAWGLGFHLGNVVKYISRAGRKPDADLLDDLKKARWYLDRYLAVEVVRAAMSEEHSVTR